MIHVFSSGLCGKLCPGSVSHEKGAVIGRPGLVTEDRSKEDIKNAERGYAGG